MRARGWWLFTLVLLPLTTAAPIEAEFLVDGSIGLPLAARVGGPLVGLFAASTSNATEFTITAPLVRVTRYDAEYARVSMLPDSPRVGTGITRADFDLHDVNIELTSAGPGWIGFRTTSAASLDAIGIEPVEVQSLPGTRLGNGVSGDDPSVSYIQHDIEMPIVIVDDAADIAVVGSGVVKWIGLDVSWTSAENSSSIDTGWFQSGPTTERETWILMTIADGEMVYHSRDPIHAALERADVVSNGTVRFRASSAAIEGAGVEYELPADRHVQLNGLLATEVVPADDGETSRVRVRGDVTASTLIATAPVAASPGTLRWLPWLGFLIFGLVATVGVTFVTTRRRRAHALHAEEYAHLAMSAADEERWDDALSRIRQARRKSPTSQRLLLDEAYIAWRAGDRRAAEELFALADRTMADGAAEVTRARLLLEEERVAEAVPLVVRALEKAPIMLIEVEEDIELHGLAVHHEVREAIACARRALM